jgi:MFS family permease
MTPRDLLRIAPLVLGTSIVPLDGMVNVAFPAVLAAFALEVPQIQWLVICYVLTYGALLLAVGRIGDVLGHARVFRFGLAWSAVAFVACAAAPSYGWLLGARVLQGIGAALVLGCGPALATALYPDAMRVRALAAYAAGVAAGGAVGPVLGGVLVQAFDWPAVWAVRAPIALAALWLARGMAVPARGSAREPFHLAGALLLTATVASAVLAVNRAPSWLAIVLAVAALGCAAGFAWRSARNAHPIIDVALFRRPGFAALNLASALVQFAGFAVMLLVPFHLARGLGLSPLLLGLVLLANAVGSVAGSWLGGGLGTRLGARAVAALGAVLSACGLLLVGLGGPLAMLVAALVLQGLGLALFTLAYTDVVTATMRREDRGVAGSLTQLTRTIGVVSAASLLTLLFGTLEAARIAGGAAPDAAFGAAFRMVFLVVAPLPLLALLALPRRVTPRGG